MRNIDFTKRVFTAQENESIKRQVLLVKHKYPKCLPVVIIPRDKNLKLERLKFLVSQDITVGQLMIIVRRKVCKLESHQALYMFVNNVVPPSGELLLDVYSQHKNKDNDMLFVDLYLENTFGKN